MVQKFEELDCWQVARELTREVYSLTAGDACRRDFGFVDQFRRASVSIMNNVAEGFERGSDKDFVKFLYIARASAGEVRSMTYVGLDQNYLSESDFQKLQDLCRRSSALCWGLIKSKKSNLGLASKLSLLLFTALIPLLYRT
ncbi:MAG TPA: four helix bundle protein [Kiritimatiellia bacterium]|nr:four helix bundle protein [Kiritimatiellia bacterium]